MALCRYVLMLCERLVAYLLVVGLQIARACCKCKIIFAMQPDGLVVSSAVEPRRWALDY
jgi:hypothetical protein